MSWVCSKVLVVQWACSVLVGWNSNTLRSVTILIYSNVSFLTILEFHHVQVKCGSQSESAGNNKYIWNCFCIFSFILELYANSCHLSFPNYYLSTSGRPSYFSCSGSALYLQDPVSISLNLHSLQLTRLTQALALLLLTAHCATVH